jgi:alkylation response protein AidB-like acyl-CoA dehydrogenase
MTSAQEYLDRVAGIADVVRADAEQAEVERRLGDKTVDALRETGLLRMLMPPEYGGGDLRLGETFAIVEALSRVNGSAGWNLQIGATTNRLACDLPDDARDEVFGDDRAVVAGTINFINIAARRDEGGFVFDGPATFLSGSSHASWLVVGGWLRSDAGKPQIRKGNPRIVRGVIPIDGVALRDTWHVSGMRATASNDATLEGLFVPDAWMCDPDAVGLAPADPAARLPLFSRFGGGLSWVGIGIARGAFDALNVIAADKVPIGGQEALAARTDVQIDTARAHGLVEAGAALLRQAWDEAETKLLDDERLDARDQAMLRLSYVTAAEYAASATDIVMRAAGSAGLYERDGIERCWRDANAVTKHVTVSARRYEHVGRILLGLPPLPGPI